MVTAGIIANPASGKDIRRLVAYGTVFDNQEKVNIVRRILLGLSAAGVEKTLYMPDYYGIVPKALLGLQRQHQLTMEVVPVEMCVTGTQNDSKLAAIAMNEAGVGSIITLGGDGTNRMVAKGCGDVPLVPVSTGTNNVFPTMVEGTIAGLAAGVVACGVATGTSVLSRSKKLIVSRSGQPDEIALVDVVMTADHFIGSRAVWEVSRIRQIVLTRGEPSNIGVSSIGGNLAPIGPAEARGLTIDFGHNVASVLAPIAPGMVLPVPFEAFRRLEIGEVVRVFHTPCVIALDGERELEVKPGETVSVRLTFDGPIVVDIHGAMAEAAEKKFFVQ